MTKKTVGIIGFGRFGKVLHTLFKDGFGVIVSSSSYKPGDVPDIAFMSLEETVARADALFLSVPINKIGDTAALLKPHVRPGQLIVDVCSVKETPFRALTEGLEGCGVHIWPTHPMFGPDSTKNGFQGLTWVSCEDGLNPEVLAPYISYLDAKGLLVFRTDCESHDKIAASTQGLTHLIGRYLNELHLAPTPMDTLGYKRLCAVRDQTCNDTFELFVDLMRYNRFSRDIQRALEDAVFKVSSKLCDRIWIREDRVLGIVGANDKVADELLNFAKEIPFSLEAAPSPPDKPMRIRVCGDAEAVLSALACGEVDIAAVPLIEAKGKICIETITAMGKHDFNVVGEFSAKHTAEAAQFVLLAGRRCARLSD